MKSVWEWNLKLLLLKNNSWKTLEKGSKNAGERNQKMGGK